MQWARHLWHGQRCVVVDRWVVVWMFGFFCCFDFGLT
jgi:hypothetical protein